MLDVYLVRPDLDPNCLQRLSADNSSRQRDTGMQMFIHLDSPSFIVGTTGVLKYKFTEHKKKHNTKKLVGN